MSMKLMNWCVKVQLVLETPVERGIGHLKAFEMKIVLSP